MCILQPKEGVMPVCLNHTERKATTKCTTCFKPLCRECAIKDAGRDFCSNLCKANYASTNERIGYSEDRRRAAKRQKLIELVIVLLSLAAACAFAFSWFKKNPATLEKLKKDAQSMGEKVKGTAQGVKKEPSKK